VAHGAFSDPGGERLVVFVGRDFKRAGDHAVSAPHAYGFVVGDSPVPVLGERPHETGGRACRLQAVVALDFSEYRLTGGAQSVVTVDHRVGIRLRPPLFVEH